MYVHASRLKDCRDHPKVIFELPAASFWQSFYCSFNNMEIMMKTSFIVLTTALLSLGMTTNAAAADKVRGYVRKDGTYVAPYTRSTRDSTPYNNYSTKGNSNPYTGKKGYKTPSKHKILPRKY